MLNYNSFLFDFIKECPVCNETCEIIPEISGAYLTMSEHDFSYNKFGFTIEFGMITKDKLGSQVLNCIIEYTSYSGITIQAFNRFGDEIDTDLGSIILHFYVRCDCDNYECLTYEYNLKEKFQINIMDYTFYYKEYDTKIRFYHDRVDFIFNNSNLITKYYNDRNWYDLLDYDFLTSECDRIKKTLILN